MPSKSYTYSPQSFTLFYTLPAIHESFFWHFLVKLKRKILLWIKWKKSYVCKRHSMDKMQKVLKAGSHRIFIFFRFGKRCSLVAHWLLASGDGGSNPAEGECVSFFNFWFKVHRSLLFSPLSSIQSCSFMNKIKCEDKFLV